MLELSNFHVTLGFTLPFLGKLPFNFTAPLSRITQLCTADLQAAVPSIVLDQEPWVALWHLLAIEVDFPFRLSLGVLQPLCHTILRISRFHLQVTLAGEIVAFSDDTSVTPTVLHLWVLDGQGVGTILFV